MFYSASCLVCFSCFFTYIPTKQKKGEDRFTNNVSMGVGPGVGCLVLVSSRLWCLRSPRWLFAFLDGGKCCIGLGGGTDLAHFTALACPEWMASEALALWSCCEVVFCSLRGPALQKPHKENIQ